MNESLLQQIKKRRTQLGLKQEDQDDLMTNPWKGLLGGEEP